MIDHNPDIEPASLPYQRVKADVYLDTPRAKPMPPLTPISALRGGSLAGGVAVFLFIAAVILLAVFA